MQLYEPVPEWIMTDLVEVIFDDLDSPSSPSTTFPVLKDDTYFRAVIPYEGTFTSGHETGCLWRYMGGGIFALRGIAPESNYQT